VFLMTLVAAIILAKKRGVFQRKALYFLAVVATLAVTILVWRGSLGLQNVGSLNAFVSEEREGSTVGKVSNAKMGWELFKASPLVGYGARKFADLTLPLGNENAFQAESHSYVLSTVLGSGLIGFLAYVFAAAAMVRALWSGKSRALIVVCAMFVGLNIYNIVYDAGGLDVFACFNGIAAYFAVASDRVPRRMARSVPKKQAA